MNFIRKALCVAMTAATASCMFAREWHEDILGPGFEYTTVDQGTDYAGPVCTSVIRLKTDCNDGKHRAILYVHGYNDYFFQEELARTMADSCWNFYAVDLRKYGRSILPENKKFQVRDIREYFADIDSAIAIIKEDGVDEVALMGHSTGGLTTTLYMAEHPDTIVKTLILNSPFYEWNQSSLNRNLLIPAMDGIGKLFPGLEIPQGDNTSYAESLLKNHHGEWEYNTDWKLFKSQPVEASWIRAIDKAQADLRNRIAPVEVPMLLAHSDHSLHPKQWTEACDSADVVLDVEHISRIGRTLGTNVTEAIVPGGMHDLALSAPGIRHAYYDTVLAWLRRTMPNYQAYRHLYK